MKKNSRIGILTFHNVPNYGAVLQTVALKKYVESLGYQDVRVINYTGMGNGEETSIDNMYRRIRAINNLIKRVIKQIIFCFNRTDYINKLRKFDDFRNKYMNLDYQPEKLNDNYEVILYGSDQIWNPEITGGFNDFYYAKNISNKKIITVAFAVSCGDLSVIKGNQTFLELANNFDNISTREKSLSDYINTCGLKSECVLDPTFLLTADDYIQMFNIGKNNKSKYILVYELQRNPELLNIAKRMANGKGLKIKRICGYFNHLSINTAGIYDAGPQDFLELLNNAEYVLTNSFHGVALSVIFKKNFNVVLPKSRTSRITELLSRFALDERIVEGGTVNENKIDYIKVNKLVEKDIIDTRNYLISVLSKEKKVGTI